MSYFEFPHTRSYDGDLGYIIKRLDELTAKYGEFMEYNQIKFADPVQWNINTVYSAWEIVFADNGYYIAVKPVPAGIMISNSDYWELITPFDVDTILDTESLNPVANSPVARRFNQVSNSISNVVSSLQNEGRQREEHDAALRLLIDANTDACAANASAISSETTARETADTSLSRDLDTLTARVDNIAQTIVPGGTSGDAELADIRVGADGITYPTAGDAVRGQIVYAINTANTKDLIYDGANNSGISALAANMSIKTGTVLVPDETISNKLIGYNGSLSSSANYTIRKYTVTQGNFYRVIAYSVDKFVPFAIYDSSDNCLFDANAVNKAGYVNAWGNYLINAPRDAAYMLVETNYDNSVFDLGKDINDIFNRPVDDTVKYLLGNQDFEEDETITVNTKTLIYANGSVATYNDERYKTTDLIEVTPLNYYRVIASATYLNLVYAFYDDTERFISGVASANSGTPTVKNEIIQIPSNVRYIRLSMVSSADNPHFYTRYEARANSLRWGDKKWVCVGDSLTEVNATSNTKYYDYISDLTGIQTVNMGVSGTDYKAGEGNNNAFYQRISNVPTDADVVTIFGSFNDGYSNLGTATDTGTATVAGCINTTLDNLYAIMPTVQLGIVSPTPWQGSNPYTNPAANAYADLLEAICKRRSIPFLNLYYESNLRPWDATFRQAAYSKDGGNGVHPDETGHKIIASRFEGFLETLLLSK